VALALGFLGAVLSLRPGLRVTPPAALLAVGMAVCFAGYVVMTRMLRMERTTTNVFYTALGVFVSLSLVAPTFWKPLTFEAFVPMAAVGVVGFAGLYALDRALALAEVTAVAPLLFSQVAFALLLTAAAGDRVGRSTLAGVGLVAAVSVWHIFSEAREQGRQS
jgi:drug/metabolite transporter (DMT)-like permease